MKKIFDFFKEARFKRMVRKIRKVFLPSLLKRYLRRDWYTAAQIEKTIEHLSFDKKYSEIIFCMYCEKKENNKLFLDEVDRLAIRRRAAKYYGLNLDFYEAPGNFFTDKSLTEFKVPYSPSEGVSTIGSGGG